MHGVIDGAYTYAVASGAAFVVVMAENATRCRKTMPRESIASELKGKEANVGLYEVYDVLRTAVMKTEVGERCRP